MKHTEDWTVSHTHMHISAGDSTLDFAVDAHSVIELKSDKTLKRTNIITDTRTRVTTITINAKVIRTITLLDNEFFGMFYIWPELRNKLVRTQ